MAGLSLLSNPRLPLQQTIQRWPCREQLQLRSPTQEVRLHIPEENAYDFIQNSNSATMALPAQVPPLPRVYAHRCFIPPGSQFGPLPAPGTPVVGRRFCPRSQSKAIFQDET